MIFGDKKPEKTTTFTGKTVNRILEGLEEGKAYTPSELTTITKTDYRHTQEAVTFLQQLGLIEVISNGKTTLVRKTEVVA